ncbi:zinc ABC transporter permease [Bosea sp. Root381]|uniref:metal ABC transporter permease n=1 Tax=Bosea sp. Root381 TaxID=1736524 RepID=UPI0007007615|nr:metal ABC transporter permease [Bosea sp. Root381]KRE09958.1 zinc ABC transporter permease [Bosea sp. Root381]
MRRALVGIVALSVSGAPIGVFLMLRRMSLTGDAMAHAILPGAALGYLVAGFSLPAMTLGGLAAGFAVALAAGAVARVTVIKEDASLAAFYLISLALGVTIVSLRGSAVDLFHVLFGNVLALDNEVLVLLSSVASISLLALAALYRPLVMECVDPGFLRSVSRSGGIVHLTFLGLVVLNLVAGFHALGTLLAVGLMMLPAAAARFWTADITRLILLASGFAMVSGYTGLVVSYSAGSNLPAGPAIILSAGALYLGSLLLGSQGGLLRRLLPRAHLQR